MTKTIDYTIHAPDEAPAAPENFKLREYRVYEGSLFCRDFPLRELWFARSTWVERGYERCDLEVIAESVDLPDGGCFEIYSVWDESRREWGEWLDIGDGQPFDFDELKEAMSESV